MLMDSKGNNKSTRNEGVSFVARNNESPIDHGFEDYLDQREDLRPRIEKPAEIIDGDNLELNNNEAQSEMRDEGGSSLEQDGSGGETTDGIEADKKRLEAIVIPFNAEKLPRAYGKEIMKVLSNKSGDPHDMVEYMNEARWDAMRKAYDRGKGDGFTGKGAA